MIPLLFEKWFFCHFLIPVTCYLNFYFSSTNSGYQDRIQEHFFFSSMGVNPLFIYLFTSPKLPKYYKAFWVGARSFLRNFSLLFLRTTYFETSQQCSFILYFLWSRFKVSYLCKICCFQSLTWNLEMMQGLNAKDAN